MFVAVLIARGRVGFLVDAAVLGFAVGTGFAIVENATYLRDFGEAPLMLWALRGLGTGVLHGAATAVAAIVGKAMADRHPRSRVHGDVPGMAIAIVIHSVYNHLLVFPAVGADDHARGAAGRRGRGVRAQRAGHARVGRRRPRPRSHLACSW